MIRPQVKVGDQLWFVDSRITTPSGRPVVVHSVGRRWFYFGWPGSGRPRRANIRGWAVDNGGFGGFGGPRGPRGALYASEAEYRDKTIRQACWNNVRHAVCDYWTAPDGLRAEHIEQAYRLLTDTEPYRPLKFIVLADGADGVPLDYQQLFEQLDERTRERFAGTEWVPGMWMRYPLGFIFCVTQEQGL